MFSKDRSTIKEGKKDCLNIVSRSKYIQPGKNIIQAVLNKMLV